MIEQSSRASDITRQVAVISAAVFMIIAALVGTAFLTDVAPESWGEVATPVGIAVLVVVGPIGVVGIAWFSRGRIAPALALAWGLSWLAVGRLAGEPASTGIGITAIVVAVVVLLSALAMRVARGRVPSS